MVDPDHWDRDVPARTRSGRQERRVARVLGARLTPGSGSTIRAKGDAREAHLYWEFKLTRNARFPLTEGVLRMAVLNAAQVGRSPGFVVTLEGLRPPVPQDWVVLDLTTFRAIVRGEIPLDLSGLPDPRA